MQPQHNAPIDVRYWIAITTASIFGTNLGDYYAHRSGFGLLGGLPILLGLFLAVYLIEPRDRRTHQAYYWLCIIILRTGATNIADYLAGHNGLGLERGALSTVLGAVLAALAVWQARGRDSVQASGGRTLPTETGVPYWVAMLIAGILGTALGDYFEHLFGEGVAAVSLAAALLAATLLYPRGGLGPVVAYWITVAVARTAGTAIGDWLAESPSMNVGLPMSTLLTGVTFLVVLVCFPRSAKVADANVA